MPFTIFISHVFDVKNCLSNPTKKYVKLSVTQILKKKSQYKEIRVPDSHFDFPDFTNSVLMMSWQALENQKKSDTGNENHFIQLLSYWNHFNREFIGSDQFVSSCASFTKSAREIKL
jgi:hypothetical protein